MQRLKVIKHEERSSVQGGPGASRGGGFDYFETLRWRAIKFGGFSDCNAVTLLVGGAVSEPVLRLTGWRGAFLIWRISIVSSLRMLDAADLRCGAIRCGSLFLIELVEQSFGTEVE